MAKDTAADAAPTKAGFIRQFPTDTPADDIVALGAEAGLQLTRKMIWNVQSELRHPKTTATRKAAAKKTKATAKKKSTTTTRTGPKKAGGKARGKPGSAKKASTPAATRAAEQRLKALILQVGLARAEAVYDQLRQQLDALLDGG